MKFSLAFLVSLLPFLLTAQAPDTTRISAAEKRYLITKIDSLNRAYYFRPDSCDVILKRLNAKLAYGAYDSLNTCERFAHALARDLKYAADDYHFHVWYNPQLLRSINAGKDVSQIKRIKKLNQFRQQRMNYGFVDLRVLDGCIGYVKFNQFADPDDSRETLEAVSDFVGHTDAIILDLRDNEGGSQRMIGLLTRYFVKGRRTILINYRRGKKPINIRTPRRIEGTSLADKPLIILQSDKTFSAPEAFAYCMQQLHRATVIGDTTGGGAHPVKTYTLNDRFAINIPIGDVRCAMNGKNWEGTGVIPDIAVDPAQAMYTAKLSIFSTLRKNAPNKDWEKYYDGLIGELQQSKK